MARPKPSRKLHTIGTRIEKDTWDKLKKLSQPEPVSGLIRKILREYANSVSVK